MRIRRGSFLAVSLVSFVIAPPSFAADTTPPTVTITAPSDGAVVSGLVVARASASDDVQVAGVQFLVNGGPVGVEDTAEPYELFADSTQVADGSYIVEARARDTSDNLTTSPPITVTVRNSTPPPPPPPPPSPPPTPPPTPPPVPPPTPPPAPPPPTPPPASQVGAWAPPIVAPGVGVHAIQLYTGDILWWDAWEDQTAAWLWNPFTGTNVVAPVPSQFGLFCSGTAILADGRPIVNGGHAGREDPVLGHAGNNQGIIETNLFDPVSRTWTNGPAMSVARWYPTTSRLGDGRILTVGGEITPNVWADTPEIYNPSTNTWTTLTNATTTAMRTLEYVYLHLLPNGRVYGLNPWTGQCRTLNVGTQSWAMAAAVPVLNSSTVMYRPYKVLSTGGGVYGGQAQTSAYVIDLSQPGATWRSIAPMAFARFQHNLVLLPDGKVLAIGGSSTTDVAATAIGPLPTELWDPVTEQWTTMASLTEARMYHSVAFVLADGRVVSAGGGRDGPVIDHPSAEVYSPPYLFKGARPRITSSPTSGRYGSTFSVRSPDYSRVVSGVLLPLIAVTHTIHANQSYISITPTRSSTQPDLLKFAVPSRNNTPPGYYFFYLLNNQGIPSVAFTIKLS